MAPARGLRDTVRNVSLKGASLGLERACRLLVVLASASVLGQVAFGRFVYASTITALLALGTDLGLGVWTTRALARSGERKPGDGALKPEAIVRVGLALRGLAALPYCVAVAVVARFYAQGEARTAILLLGVGALINAFVDHVGAILRGYERFADEARLNTSRAILVTVAGLVTLTVGRSLAGLCAALAIANAGSAVFGVFLLTPDAGRVPELRQLRQRDWSLARVALRESLPIWVAGLLSMLYFKVDTLFLQSMAGEAELGAYGAAFKLFEGAMILPSVVLSVTFPQLARAHGEPHAQRDLERQISRWLLAMGLLVAAGCFASAAPVVRVVFGSSFVRAVPSLRVLALGLPLLFLNYGLTHFLVARDLGVVNQVFALFMLAVNVSLDVALIPRHGGPGAAWATILTEAALTACCLVGLRMATRSAQTRPRVPVAPRTDQRAA